MKNNKLRKISQPCLGENFPKVTLDIAFLMYFLPGQRGQLHIVSLLNKMLLLLLLLLSCFSRVRLCATPQTAAHQVPLSVGFSRQEYWSGLPFPSPMHAYMLSRFSHVRLHVTPRTAAYQAPSSTGFPGKNTGVGCHFLLQNYFVDHSYLK